MCTLRDPEGRPTVLDFVKKVAGRVVPVGRLDYHTSGVLLLTNDGEFAAALMHPRHKVEKVYVAKVNEPFGPEQLAQWTRSIVIDGKPTQPAKVKKLRTEAGKVWIEITLHEGKNRQIHRIGEAAGSPVLRLARVSFAGITHDGLRPGQWRYLSKDELTQLKKVLGVPRKIWPAPPLPEAERVRRVRASGERKNGRTVVQERPRGGRDRKRTKSAPQAWEPRAKPARAKLAKPEAEKPAKAARAKPATTRRGGAR
jgi:23S rRNA pseudouridine2605 synthase